MKETTKIMVLVLIIIIVVLLALFYFFRVRGNYRIAKITIESESSREKILLSVDVAETILQQAKGLSGRRLLLGTDGMIFVFSKPEKRNFWMMGMKFPLDIIWINGEKIVGLNEGVPNPVGIGVPATVDSIVPVDKVLELKAGEISKLNIKIGDSIKLEF